jgi:uncharacterized membrane protein YtjA (UPF0391 family)
LSSTTKCDALSSSLDEPFFSLFGFGYGIAFAHLPLCSGGLHACHRGYPTRTGDSPMLQWTLTFLIVALIAGALGFFGLEGAAMQIARFTFLIFLVLFVVSLLFGRRPPVV